MNTPAGYKEGWYYGCDGEKTYPATPFWGIHNTDTERLEFLMKGWKVMSTCAHDGFFIHPLTGYFSTPRLAVDCAIDIQSQKEWRCYWAGCLTTATYRITGVGDYASSFKVCAAHMPLYSAPDACRLWTIGELDDVGPEVSTSKLERTKS